MGRAAGWRLRRGRSSAENQLHSPGGLEVDAPTVKHLRLTSFCFSSDCFLYSPVKDGRMVPVYHHELIKSLEDKIITCTAEGGAMSPVCDITEPDRIVRLPPKLLHPVSYLPGRSHRATMSWTNDKGLKHVSPASVQWIELIRQGTVQDVVQGPN